MRKEVSLTVCAFCAEPLSSRKTNREHIVPEAYGGAVEGYNPLLLPVHEKCNSNMGRAVDADLLTSFLGQLNRRKMEQKRVVNPGRSPLLHLGRMKDFDDAEFSMHIWYDGEDGVSFHLCPPLPRGSRYPRDVKRPYFRGQPIEPGFVLASVPTDPAARTSFVRKVRESFPRRQIFPLDPDELRAAQVSPNIQRVADFILGNPHKEVQQTIQVDPSEPFVAKIGLTLGALLLGDRFIASADAERIRSFMREPRILKRAAIERTASGFLSHAPPADWTPTHIENAHVLLIYPARLDREESKQLACYMSFFGSQTGMVLLSSNEDLWADRIPSEGAIYVIDPVTRVGAGPIKLPEYVTWIQGDWRHPRLDRIKIAREWPLEGHHGIYLDPPPHLI